MNQNAVVIVGPGRLGAAIAWAERAVVSEVHLIGRRPSDTLAAAERQGIHTHIRSSPCIDDLPLAASWFLCVPDAALVSVAQAWGACLVEAKQELAWVAHGSGVSDLALLQQLPAQARAALHPMRALPAQPDSTALHGAPLSVLTDSQSSMQRAEEHVARWQALALPMQDGADRRRYHLACTLAANHLTGLLAWAQRLATESLGSEGARQAVLALAQSALTRMAEADPSEALTGPLVRGEQSTLQAHLDALGEGNPIEVARYRAALRALLDEATRSGRLGAAQAEELCIQLHLRQELPVEEQA
ncbi:MAG: DUF2520 domain-containing protein [Planctomycetes bacterium]|nr:DUF2520 domain-containing protein [Planctomycetota bacterium]